MLALIQEWRIRLPFWAIDIVMVIVEAKVKKKARDEHCVVTQAQVTRREEKPKNDEERPAADRGGKLDKGWP